MLLILNQITNDVFISNETKIKTLKVENKILIEVCNKESLNTIISDYPYNIAYFVQHEFKFFCSSKISTSLSL